MNPQWISAGCAVVTVVGGLLWRLVNLRIENRILGHLSMLKDDIQTWADGRFARLDAGVANDRCKPSPPARQAAIAAKRPFSAEI